MRDVAKASHWLGLRASLGMTDADLALVACRPAAGVTIFLAATIAVLKRPIAAVPA